MPRLSRGPVRPIALLVAAMGLVNLWSAILPALPARRALLHVFLTVPVRHVSHLAAAFAGFVLLALAGGLWRRKRVAWQVSVALLPLAAIAHLLKGLDWEEASLAAILTGLLWMARAQYTARSDEPTVRRGLWTLGVALAATLGYGTAGFYLLDDHFRGHFGLGDALLQTLAMFTELSDPDLVPVTHYGAWFIDSIYCLGAGTIVYALAALLRPVLHRGPATRAERARAAAIVAAHGRSSLARFVLFPDKAHWFSPGGSVIGYTVVGRTALALGDPIGPAGDAGAAVAGFVAYCQRRDWRPAFYQTLPENLSHYRAASLETLCVGGEAVVELAGFSLDGGSMKSMRRHLKRLQCAGVRVEIVDPPFSDELLDSLRVISDAWLRERGGIEKRFSLGWFDDAYLRDGPLAIVYGSDDRPCAFANVVSEYQLPETTIDLMRRSGDAPPGVMDLLFVALFAWSRERGSETFNLGLAPLSGVGVKDDDPAIARAVRLLYEHLNQFYRFKGLHQFKEKFRPSWQPRFLIYPGAAALPAVALAIVRANNAATPWWRFLLSRSG